jgi:hypothetical protein
MDYTSDTQEILPVKGKDELSGIPKNKKTGKEKGQEGSKKGWTNPCYPRLDTMEFRPSDAHWTKAPWPF